MTVRRLALALTVAITLGSGLIQGQVPSRNVNMVSGRTLPDGDPYLQRQNEPSIAASTRNPLHLLAGANDYRTVDLPGLPNSSETGDAWMGVFKSYDGGNTWRTSLIPGYPQDNGSTSPLRNYKAAADPVVRAGTNGLFYYSGIVFDRSTPAKSAMFVSRFIDNNNQEAGDPIVFLNTAIIATNDGSAFIDKPWFAVDVPRTGAPMCTVNTSQKSPTATEPNRRVTTTQSFPGGAAYAAFSLITEDATGTKSQVYLSRSTDCGLTWSAPLQISATADPINQGATMAIDPRNGTVYLAWRRFSADGTDDSIMVTRSQDQGRKWDPPGRARRFPRGTKIGLAEESHGRKFKRPVQLAELSSLDQPTGVDTFRSNAYPSMTIDGAGVVYVAWSERGFAPLNTDPEAGDARIVVSASSSLSTWSAPTPVDNGLFAGHQIMPSLSFAGGKLMVVYYDFRADVSGIFQKFVNESAAIFYGHKRHTVDVRAAMAAPGHLPVFGASVLVSEYLKGSRPGTGPRPVEQLQFNPPNLKLFKLGTVPFVGDYIDLTPSPVFVPTAAGGWTYNTAPASSPLFHAVWTDNRDVVPPGNGDWTSYTPPRTAGTSTFDGVTPIQACVPGREGMRNQNIYTARITGGLVAGSPGNTKPLSPTLPRAFVVFAQNATAQIRTFRLTIESQPTGGRASFLQAPLPPYDSSSPAPQTTLQVIVPPRSTVARNVYATSTNPHAQIEVSVKEIAALDSAPIAGGLQSTVVLNPDISNPDISNPDISNPDISNPDISNPDISNAEVSNPDISNPDISNPDISNPDISNPDISNPDISNVQVANPDISNPDISNPDISNPDISNPDISNPDISNPDISNQSLTDTTWTITNEGNTAASYSVKLLLNGAQPTVDQVAIQLILRKVYATPIAVNCTLSLQAHNVLLANIKNPTFSTLSNVVNPDVSNPDISNATLWLAPGETGKITLRVRDLDTRPGNTVTFNAATLVTPAVVSQALNLSLVGGTLVVAPDLAVAFPPALNVVLSNPAATIASGAAVGFIGVSVRDQSGAVLPGVTVALSVYAVPTDVQVGSTLMSTSNVDGTAAFTVGVLPAGAYRLQAQVSFIGYPTTTVFSSSFVVLPPPVPAIDPPGAPVLGSALTNSAVGRTYVPLSFSAPAGDYQLKFYSAPTCGAVTGTVLFTQTVTVAGSPITTTVAMPAVPSGTGFVATATNAAGSASVFSNCVFPSATGAVLWSEADGGNGHYYEYVKPGFASWNAANTDASSRRLNGLQGHLVTITSAGENTIVQSLKGAGDMRAWIGLIAPSGDNVFQWITGEPLGYQNWNVNEPNNAFTERWVEFFAAGVWNNNTENNGAIQGYVVEHEPGFAGLLMDAAGDATPTNGVSPDLAFASVWRTGTDLVFRIRFAPGTFNGPTSSAQVSLDTDQNPATGHPGMNAGCVADSGIIGTEYLIEALNQSGLSYKHTSGCNQFIQGPAVSVTLVPHGYDMTVPLSVIGGDDGRVNFKLATFVPGSGVLDYMSNIGLPVGTTGGGGN